MRLGPRGASSLRGVLGEDGARRAFGAVLTDNGSEFADEGAIAALLGERDGETRLFYCDPRQSQQKGACEKNHVEIRKLLPKGAGVRFDRLTAADCALLMSQVNSEPRGALGFLTPARVLRMALGEDASALMDAFGVEELAPGELDLTPGCIDRARAARGEGRWRDSRRAGAWAGGPVALSPERLRGGLAEHAAAGRGRRPPQPLHLRKRGDGQVPGASSALR